MDWENQELPGTFNGSVMWRPGLSREIPGPVRQTPGVNPVATMIGFLLQQRLNVR